MNLTRQELQFLVTMCDHEGTLLSMLGSMAPQARVAGAKAVAASIAAKADHELAVIAKKAQEEEAPKEE